MPLWNLFLMGLVLPPDPPAITEPAPCPTPPDYTYSDWHMYWDEHQFKDQWVIQYLHYSRTRWDECRGTSKRQTKVMGPYTLWPAVPENRVADVSRPQGSTEGVSGSPLRSSTMPGGGAPGAVGPVSTVPAEQPRMVPLNPIPLGPQPFFPGVALLVGAVVASMVFRRRKTQDPVTENAVEPLRGPSVSQLESHTLASIKDREEWVPTPVEVQWLQAFFGIEETGYGPLTQEAVKGFQRKYGIEPDPNVMVGINTYQKLWKEHLDLIHEHWQKRAEGVWSPKLERVMDSPLPPDLRAEMERLNDAYAAQWNAVEARYQAVLRQDLTLVAEYDKQIDAAKASGVKAGDIPKLKEKYQPLIDALHQQAEKVRKGGSDGDYARLLAMLDAADHGRWDEIPGATATLSGRWDALWSRDASEKSLARKVAEDLVGYSTNALLGATAGVHVGMKLPAVDGQSQPTTEAPHVSQLTLSQALEEAVDEYLSVAPAIPYELGGSGNDMSASDYQSWIARNKGKQPPGIDCSGYVLQIMQRVSQRMGWPDPAETVRNNSATYLDQKLVSGASVVELKDVQPGDLIDWDGEHIMMVISRTANADGTVTLGITDSSDTTEWKESRGPKKGTFTFPMDATSLEDGFLNLPGYGINSKHLSNYPYKIYRPTYWLGSAAGNQVGSKQSTAGGFWASIPSKAPDISRLPASLKSFGWNQQKVDAVWDYCLKQGVDPRLILAIIPQEGNGSWNTSSSNLAADGQNGYNSNFSEDLKLAVGHASGKFAFYGTALEKGFVGMAREHGLSTVGNQGQSYGNVIQFINWYHPIDKHNPSQGYYANHASWCENVAQYYKDMGGDVDALSKWVAETYSPDEAREFTLRFVDNDIKKASWWAGEANVYMVKATGKTVVRNPDDPRQGPEVREKLASGEWVLHAVRHAEPAIISMFP